MLEDTPARVVSAYLDASVTQDLQRDLSRARRSGGARSDSEWAFTSVRMETPQSAIGREPLRLAITYRCRAETPDARVRVSICHPNGTYLAAARSLDDGQSLHFSPTEEGLLRVELEVPPLLPGLYRISLGANAAGQRDLDVVPDALHFEVPPSRDGDPALAQPLGSLGVQLKARWELRRERPEAREGAHA